MKTLTLIIIVCIFSFGQQDSAKKIINEDIIIEVLPPLPEIVGGLDSLQSRLQYPYEALKNRIEGKVYLIVTTDTAGIPSNPKVMKNLGYGCDEEAIRLVLTSKYIPAIQDGKKVKSTFMLRILFRLPKN